MKTQSISQMSAVQSMSTGKAAKTSQAAFDSFMSQSASRVDAKSNSRIAVKQSDNVSGKSADDVNSSRDDFSQRKISLTNKNQTQGSFENVELGEVEKEVVQLLQDTFGLSEEDVVDLLEILGLAPIDLALFMTPDSVNIGLVNVENIKAFIMEFHGVDDESLFLMSDQMSGEMNDIMNGIQDLLSQELGVDISQLSQDDTQVMQSFAEKLGQFLNQADGNLQNEVAAEQDVTEEVASAGLNQEIPVVVETSEESGASDAFQNETQGQSMTDSTREVSDRGNESPISAFVERLTESFEQVRQEEPVATQVTMNDIVQQVVNHVRIRVLPQTTSMELQLNPESLGRVNLNVTSQNGTATATLTVQNQVAKEALESQMAVLKENLENQGLKVESVEVNVSYFGFKHQEDSNSNNQYQQKKSQTRRFRFDSAAVEEEDSAVKPEERQDSDSVVDYTA